jgi:drug/metabolite transporter (DMT)-like permease
MYALLALGLFAGNAFLVRPATARLEQEIGFLVVLVSNVAFGAVLVVLDRIADPAPLRVDPVALAVFAVAGVFTTYLGRRGYFHSLQALGPSRATAMQNSTPLFTVLVAWLLLGQALGWVELLLMAAIVYGLYLTGSSARRRSRGSAPPAVPWRDVLVALAAAAAYAVGNVLRGGAVERWHEPIIGAFAGAVAAVLVYTAVHISPRRLVRRLRAAPRDGVLLWTGCGAVMICAQAALIAATAYLPVAVAVAISSATPVIVIPISVLLLGNRERVGVQVAAGAALVGVGAIALLLR